MPPKKEPDKKLDNQTPLQKFVDSKMVDNFILSVIIINCGFMAAQDPKYDSETAYNYYGTWIINIIFIIECVLRITAYSFITYIMDPWRVIDFVVVLVSLIEVMIPIIDAISVLFRGPHIATGNANLLKVLRILRTLRVLRPLKAINFIPSLQVYIDAVFTCARSVIIQFVLLLIVFVSLAFFTHSVIGESLLYRCVPTDFTADEVTSNAYYTQYGIDYFYSRYNYEFCGNNHICSTGFECINIDLPFEGSTGDFSTPWRAFITNFSFVSLRGWPLIFWAIADVKSVLFSWFLLILICSITACLCVNMFPAIFIFSLKSKEEVAKKIEIIDDFPGNIMETSELELMLWASKNGDYIKRKREKEIQDQASWLVKLVQSLPCCSPTFFYQKNTNTKGKPYDPDSTNPNKYSCVPSSYFFINLRRLINSDTGPFSRFISFIVFLNIGILALDSSNPSTAVILVIKWVNIGCSTFFFLEVVLKLGISGPIMYFSDPWNLLDLSLAILSIPFFVSDSQSFSSNFRTFRLLKMARLARLAQVFKVVRTVDVETAMMNRNPSLTVGRFVGMLLDLVVPLTNVTLLVLIFMFIFAILGMEFFARPKGPKYKIEIESTYDQYLAAPLVELDSILAGGKYLPRMNFNCFGNAYVTILNVVAYNGWYPLMIEIRRKVGGYACVYFIFLIFIIDYFIFSTLTASLIGMMEMNADKLLGTIAEDNKKFLERLTEIRQKCIARHYFNIFKQKTIETEEAQAAVEIDPTPKMQREEIQDAYEPPVDVNCKEALIEATAHSSFYVFSERNPVRRFSTVLLDNSIFQGAVLFAIFVAATSIITDRSEILFSEENWTFLDTVLMIVFLTEMLLMMIRDTLWEYPKGYIYSLQNVADIAVNGFMILDYVLESSSFNEFRIVRLVKLPAVVKYFLRSKLLNSLLKALEQSVHSTLAIMIVVLVGIFYISVIGLQTYAGTLNRCSYDEYPGGRGRFEKDDTYPNGCNGYAYIDWDHQGYYEWIKIFWYQAVDNFDDIFKSCRVTVRVMFNYEWQGAFYGALDAVDVNVQPKNNNQREAFLFFFIVYLIGFTLCSMPVAVVYYHHYLIYKSKGKKACFGGNSSLWLIYEDKLMTVKPTVSGIAAGKAVWRTKILKFMKENKSYNFAILLSMLIPIFWMFLAFDTTYKKDEFLFVDLAFSALYLFDYILRVFGFGPVLWTTTAGFQELIVSIGIATAAALTVLNLSRNTAFARDLILIQIILRTNRLTFMYPELAELIQVQIAGFIAYIPLALYLAVTVLIFGIFFQILLGENQADFGLAYINDRFNFDTKSNSWVLLLTIGSGNMYSEVFAAYKSNLPIWKQALFEFVLCIYSFTFYVLFRCFCVMMVNEYLLSYGDKLGLAGQQIRHFQSAWELLGNPSSITYRDMYRLIRMLPPPLGLGSAIIPYLDQSRFVKRIMVCMPMDVKEFNDYNPKKRRQLFKDDDDIPADIRDWNEGITSNFRFSFTQIILALHKNYIMSKKLIDEADSIELRRESKLRVKKITLRLARLIISRTNNNTVEPIIRASKNLSLLQRLDGETYKTLIVDVMSKMLSSIELRTTSFGFKGFDSFVLSNLTKVANEVLQSFSLQIKLKKALCKEGVDDQNILKAAENMQHHFLQARRYHAAISALYDSKIEKLWEIEGLEEITSMKDKKGVTAVCTDGGPTIFCGINPGKIKVFKNTGRSHEITKKTAFRMTQTIKVGGAIRSISSTNDAKKVVAACESEVILIYLVPKRGRKPQYIINTRYSYHSGPINKVMFWDNYILSFGNDGIVCFWSSRGNEPVNVVSADSSIFCATSISTIDSNTALDEVLMTEALVCGLSSGNLQVIPLPLLSGLPDNERLQLIPKTFAGSNCAVSSICTAWGFVYAGFTDGTLKTWAITLSRDSKGYPIEAISLEPVQSVTVHAAPISALLFTGNHLFTVSHDFSILPFKPPDKLSAKSAAQFSQEHLSAYIIHNSPIICATGNKYGLISCDDEGIVKISAPDTATDLNITDADNMSSSKYRFSFSEYSFEEVFIAHQGIGSQEEAILEITNTSFEAISVRCLLSKDPHFSIGFFELHNQGIGVKSKTVKTNGPKGAKKTAIEISPQQTAKLKICFAPTETKHYRIDIGFLVDETELVKIPIKGYGVKSKVVTANNQRVFDLEVVDVNKTKVEIISLINTSPREVTMTFFDRPQEDKQSNGLVTFASKDITIIPRCLKLGPRETSKIVIQYSPTQAHNTFSLTLKAAIHGAEYTIGKIIGRSQEERGASSRGGDGNTHDKEKKEVIKYMTRGLRPLLYTENLCPNDLSDMFLDKCGWKLSYNDDLILFYHLMTGQFLEIPRSAPGLFRPMITDIQIDFICSNKIVYELWLGNRKIAAGKANEDEVGVIDISIDAINFESQDKAQSVGIHIFELLIFSPGSKKREGLGKVLEHDPNSEYGSLQTITNIKVTKGFRISKFESDGIFKLSDRIAVLGIERVVTFLEDETGSVYEIYGEMHEFDKGSRTFSPLVMSVGSKLSPTHYNVTDTAAAVERETSKIKEHISTFSDLFQSSNSNEVISMPMPVMDLKGDDHVSRKIEVTLQRQQFTEDKEVLTLKDLKTIKHECHTTKHIHSRAHKVQVSEDLLLPHQVQSFSHSVSVRTVAPPEESKKIYDNFQSLLDSLIGGNYKKNDQSIIHGQWHFVLDLDSIKIVYSEMVRVDDNEIGEHDYESTEIQFTTFGFVAKLCDGNAFKSENGYISEDNTEVIYDITNPKTISLYNIGKALTPIPYNNFLCKAWDIIVKDEMVKALKRSLKKMADHKLLHLTKIADDKIQLKLQELKEMESKTSKKVDMSEKKKEIFNACDAIRKTIPEKVTPAFIYEVITGVTNDYFNTNYVKSAGNADSNVTVTPRLNIFKFRYYLENVPIAGATDPMSKARSEIVLRELNRDDNDIASSESFKFWYVMDNSKKVIESLTGKTLLALVVNDVIADDAAQAVIVKDEEVEADAEHIKNLHLDVDWDGTSHEALHETDVSKMEWHDGDDQELAKLPPASSKRWKKPFWSSNKSSVAESAIGDSVSTVGDRESVAAPKKKWFSFLRKKDKPELSDEEGVEIKSINKTHYSAVDSESKIESGEESGAEESVEESDQDLGILEDSDAEESGDEEDYEESGDEEEEYEESGDEEEEEEESGDEEEEDESFEEEEEDESGDEEEEEEEEEEE